MAVFGNRITRVIRAALTALVISGGLITPSVAQATDPPNSLWPLVVTEIAPDNTGYDNFEFFEVVNTTTQDISLDVTGVHFAYTYTNTDDRAKDVALTVPVGTIIPVGTPVVFWVEYTTSTVDTSSKTEADFRSFYTTETGQDRGDYPIVRVTGQAGLANGGDRGIRIIGGGSASISWSFYSVGSAAVARSTHFKLPQEISSKALNLLEPAGVPSPGFVSPEALIAPVDPPVDPPVVPSDRSAKLEITELLPDSINVAGADGYEFIEVYNPTNRSASWGDYTLRYLYPLADLTNSSVVDWPSKPENPVIEPGGRLVLWIKNGPNNTLTIADFNAVFGTALTLGKDLVEVSSAGMANASPRGLEISTRTGFSVSRAYYNLGGVQNVVANIGLQYVHDSADPIRQKRVATTAPTPGTVSSDQVAQPLLDLQADSVEPTVTDNTSLEFTSNAPLQIAAKISDNVQVKSVTLLLSNSIGEAEQTINLVAAANDYYSFSINPVDLVGKRWFDYSLIVSDGKNTITTPTRRIGAIGVDTSPLRLSVAEGQYLAGTSPISAAADTYPSNIALSINGKAVVKDAPALESQPVFAFEAGGVDTFFKNGVLIGSDVIRIFDDGIYVGYDTISVPVPLSYIIKGEHLTLSVVAGTKAAPAPDPNENNDDFQIKNLRLILPDGRSTRPEGYEDPTKVLNMGDSAGKLDSFDATFTLPDDAFRARSFDWQTTTETDGEYTISATNGTDSVSRRVIVDNTTPDIATSMVDGKNYQGAFVIDATATDGGSGVGKITATLDEDEISLPLMTSSLTMQSGEHRLIITAKDVVGNTGTRELRFTTPHEQPSSSEHKPAESAVVSGPDVDLVAKVTDPSSDRLSVTFNEGFRLTPMDAEVASRNGTVPVANTTDRSNSKILTAEDLSRMSLSDGLETEVSSVDEFPYQLFDVAVPVEAGEDSLVRVSWSGSANADAKVLLYVLNTATNRWEELDRHVTPRDASESFSLDGSVVVKDHTQANRVRMLVQHSEGFTGAELSTRSDPNPQDPKPLSTGSDVTPRSNYDFTLGWETDTQYYNDTYFDRQLDIHRYFLDNRLALNLQYVFHTGDIVDNHTDQHQWDNATAAYSMLDDSKLPYGVLAGNHDVGHKEVDYGPYSKYFGQNRYENNPWYGELYQDNRGHFDLISEGGLDFIMLYMGWNPEDKEIAWMNEVLARYPERKAIINLHEYMLTTGGLGPIPQQIHDEVVAANPNVIMVFSGHYHDAFTRVDGFDDNGDGVIDRKVHQILFDFQSLPEGGQAFLRLMHFDNQDGQVISRTYSPYLDQYNSNDPSLEPQHQEFTMPYADLNLVPRDKVLSTDSFQAEVLTSSTIASFTNVASGTTLTAKWAKPTPETHGWYVTTTDPYGAVERSAVRLFSLTEAPPVTPTQPPSNKLEPTPSLATSGDLQEKVLGETANGQKMLAVTGSESILPLACLFLLLGLVLLARRPRFRRQ